MRVLSYGKSTPTQRTDATLLVVTDDFGNLLCFVYESQPGATTMVRQGDADFVPLAQRLGLGKLIAEATRIRV